MTIATPFTLNRISPMSLFERPSKSVLFCDFDGPIVDVAERYYRTYRLGLSTLQMSHQAQQGETLPLQLLSKQQFWGMKRHRVADVDIAMRSGVPEHLVETLLHQVGRIVNHPYLLRWDCLQPGADCALRQIKQMGTRLVLVTLRHPRQVKAFLQAHDLSQYVDEVFGASDVSAAHLNRVEQKAELLQAAIAAQQDRGYITDFTYMIGDTEADIVAGQTANLRTVALTCGIRSQSYLENYQPAVVASNLLEAVYDTAVTEVLQAA